MAEEKKDGAPKAAAPSMRTPEDWAKAKGTDPMLLAAATVGKKWDRVPTLELIESEFDAAIEWAGKVSAG